MKIAIIGGGASGMVCAFEAKHRDNEVLLFEQNELLGRKLRTTGNGRGNLAHENISPKNFHTTSPHILKAWLEQVNFQEISTVLEMMGIVLTKERRGRYYPLSFEAKAVSELMAESLKQKGVQCHLGQKVVRIEALDKGVRLFLAEGKSVVVDKVVIATGGLAAPALGANRSGHQFLESLGHECLALSPAIVHLVSEDKALKILNGLKWTAKVSLEGDKRAIVDEVHFAKDALSGPAVFQLSIVYQKKVEKPKFLLMDFLPDYDKKACLALLLKRKAQFKTSKVVFLLQGILPEKLAEVVLERTGLYKKISLEALTENDLQRLIDFIKAYRFSLLGTRDYTFAQSTLGGIHLEDFEVEEYYSYFSPDVYAIGEVLDVCGDCGGYNLYFAWLSGILVGRKLNLETREAVR